MPTVNCLKVSTQTYPQPNHIANTQEAARGFAGSILEAASTFYAAVDEADTLALCKDNRTLKTWTSSELPVRKYEKLLTMAPMP